jgi:hypothetical protein
MRSFAGLVLSSLFVLIGCSADDGSVTDDSAEINEGRGSIERELDPPMAPPTSPLIGAKMSDVLAKATTGTTKGTAKKGKDCSQTDYKSTSTKKIVVEHLVCAGSETIRLVDEDGLATEEHFDLNKDGKVDRFAGTEGAIVTYGDSDYDGKIDLIIERVDRLKDFSLKGYDDEDEDLSKSRFLHRIREDRDHDGKLDHERLTAKGTLPAQKN